LKSSAAPISHDKERFFTLLFLFDLSRYEQLGTQTMQKHGFHPHVVADDSIEWSFKLHLCDGDGESKGAI
jgi:hypothetical protein